MATRVLNPQQQTQKLPKLYGITRTQIQRGDISEHYYMHNKKLGEGGFAKVKLGTHLATNQPVAIKCIDKSKVGSELPRIYNEVECLNKLQHKNIARLMDVFESDTTIYLVLEYCSGGELFDYIVSKSRLEEDESALIINDLMRVLEFIHLHGFAHRDLKPENVLFDDKHSIKLIDFGLAANCSSKFKGQSLDQLRTCCGSVTYAAPELISGKAYSGPAVDVWSAGVMLYALLVGQLPFNDTSIPKLYQQIQGGIKTLPSHLSPGASDLIRRMLTVDPPRRITVPEVLFHPWIKSRVPPKFAQPNNRACQPAKLETIEQNVVSRIPPPTTMPKITQPNTRYQISKQQKPDTKIPQPIDVATSMKESTQKKEPSTPVNSERRQYRRPILVTRTPPLVKRTPPIVPRRPCLTAGKTAGMRESPNKRTIAEIQPGNQMSIAELSSSPSKRRAIAKRIAFEALEEKKVLSSVDNSPSKKKRPFAAITPLRTTTPNSDDRMSAFIYEPSPKKSIMKRILESATPSRLKQPRKILLEQNDPIMNITLTSYTDPNLCLEHFNQALVKKGFKCKRKDFSLKCATDSLQFTLEVCKFNDQCAIQRKRIKGDAWNYKNVCEEILRLSNTDYMLDQNRDH